MRLEILKQRFAVYALQLVAFLVMTQTYEQDKFVSFVDPEDGVQLRVRADASDDLLDVTVFINIILSALLLYSMFF